VLPVRVTVSAPLRVPAYLDVGNAAIHPITARLSALAGAVFPDEFSGRLIFASSIRSLPLSQHQGHVLLSGDHGLRNPHEERADCAKLITGEVHVAT
jgi:hypothetical protein